MPAALLPAAVMELANLQLLDVSQNEISSLANAGDAFLSDAWVSQAHACARTQRYLAGSMRYLSCALVALFLPARALNGQRCCARA